MEIKEIKLNMGTTKSKAYVIDSVFSYEEIYSLYGLLLEGPFEYSQMSDGQSDIKNARMSMHLETVDNPLLNLYRAKMDSIIKKLDLGDFQIAEMYVNISDAMSITLPHADRPKDCWTILYYPNYDWDIKYGGQTNFIDNNQEIIASCIPKPGRFLVFRSDMLHQATPPTFFSPFKRLTLATKLEPREIQDQGKEDIHAATNTCWE